MQANQQHVMVMLARPKRHKRYASECASCTELGRACAKLETQQTLFGLSVQMFIDYSVHLNIVLMHRKHLQRKVLTMMCTGVCTFAVGHAHWPAQQWPACELGGVYAWVQLCGAVWIWVFDLHSAQAEPAE